MIDNSIKIDNDISVYTDRILELADIFIQNEYGDNIPEKINFKYMISWIAVNTRIDTRDIYILDNIFTTYVLLCNKYNYNPTIEQFRQLIHLPSNVFYSWANGKSRKVTPDVMTICKKWIDICKGSLINDLSNSDKTSVNKIYITKSVYGMSETLPTNNADAPGRYVDSANLPTLSVVDGQPEKLVELSDNFDN